MLSVKWSLLACCSLAQNDAYICRMFVEFHKILKPLLEIVNNYSSDSETDQQIKAIALRVLTILCINRDAVQLLIEECLYNQFLSSVITNESNSLITEEAMDLMVELSRSLIETKGSDLDKRKQIIVNDFIDCLNPILKTIDNEKIFSSICSSLANISFYSNESILRNDTLNAIIDIFNKSFDNIFARDQIITVLANMSKAYPLEVVRSGGLVLILSSIHLKPEELRESEEMSALERIQQKAVVAIARLTFNSSVTQVLFRLNVIQRLIQLCKEPKQRNFSEGVLMASIAALKRLAKVEKTETNFNTTLIC